MPGSNPPHIRISHNHRSYILPVIGRHVKNKEVAGFELAKNGSFGLQLFLTKQDRKS